MAIMVLHHHMTQIIIVNKMDVGFYIRLKFHFMQKEKRGVQLRLFQENLDGTGDGAGYDTWACTSLLPEITGSQGTQGLQGLQGTAHQGSQGLQGNQGTQGLQGQQGLQGLQGTAHQGVQGLQGRQGLQGNQGNQGLQGDQGVISNFQGTQGLHASTIVDPESVFEIMLFT